MTTHIVHQESAARSLCNAPALFTDEWIAHCARLLVSDLKQGGEPLAVYCQFCETHPPLFLGVRVSSWVLGPDALDSLPRLWREGDRLWVAPDWGVESPHPVQVIPIVTHRLVILVTRDLLLVLRESELAEALAGVAPTPAEPAIGGGA